MAIAWNRESRTVSTSKAWGRNGFRTIHEEDRTGLLNSPGSRMRNRGGCATIAPLIGRKRAELPEETQAERRKSFRMGMALPVRVTGFTDEGAAWEEVTGTEDVSQGGLSVRLTRRVELGQVLGLSLPMPKRLREFDLNDSTYRVYGLVRGIVHKDDKPRVGVMFFGKYPPRGFHERPGARYLLPSDSVAGMPVPPELRQPVLQPPPPPSTPPAPPSVGPAAPPPEIAAYPSPSASGQIHLDPMAPALHDRRSSPRMSLFVNFTLQLVDEWGTVLQEELTVADNLSRGGAHVMTSLEFAKNDVIQLEESGGGFATRAEVRGVKRGRDGIIRLHLRFLDSQTPDRLLGIKG